MDTRKLEVVKEEIVYVKDILDKLSELDSEIDSRYARMIENSLETIIRQAVSVELRLQR